MAASSKISPGCKRITIDLPVELYDRVADLATTSPAIPVSEWIRRVIAHHAKYELPPLRERMKLNLRLDGTRTRKPYRNGAPTS